MTTTDVLMSQREATAADDEQWQKPCRDVLAALRDGDPTRVHFDHCTRIKYWLSPSDVAGFEDALRIYGTNDQQHLEKIQNPILNIPCSSTGRESNAAASRSNAQAALL
ncbi:hypothetical protein E4U52_008171 [Claviceps spartinae]|nr:hypothetical protein E4U52_008171 [Claviceps spartinae]